METKKKLISIKKIILLNIFLLLSTFNFTQTYVTTNSGSWTTNSTWFGGTKPSLTGGGGQLSDDVIIDVGHTVILSGNLTVKNGTSLTVRGTLIVSSSGNLDFQLGSIILVESGGTLEMNGLTNSNNSTNVTIHGSLIVNGNFSAGSGSQLTGNGSMEVSGTSSGSGTAFGVVLTCDNCTVMSGGVIEDVIVDGNVQNIDIPMDCNYRYNYTESIYYKSEINKEGNITSLSFEYDGYEAFTEPIKLYLGHTTKTEFNGSTDWVKSSNMQLVYDGNYTVNKSYGWYTINFDTPFYYNNSDNLVVGFYEYGPNYHSSSADFYSYSTHPYDRVIYFDSDSQNPNPASPPTADGTWYYTPSLKLKIEPAGSPLPVNLVSFTGTVLEEQIAVLLKWITANEHNNDYFTLWRSFDGYGWDVISIEKGSGNSKTILEYIYLDRNPKKGINYYNLSQTDYDGETEFYGIISVDVNKLSEREYVKLRFNLQGQIIGPDEKGPQILVWNNGDVQKIMK